MQATAHLQIDDLEAYVHNRLDSASAAGIQSHVRQCPPCGEKLATLLIAQLTALSESERNGIRERRIGERNQKGEAGCLQTLSPLSFEQSDIHVLDVSKDGFAVLTPAALKPGAIVHVRAGAGNLLGEVRYCRNTDDGKFRAGIQFRTARKLPVTGAHHGS
ncbi:MAG TPA: hypothetical protein VN841_28445 [Bryobacteraceae bacterium]|nr:hypothetical protein [Bryobacteraceae bacterium]